LWQCKEAATAAPAAADGITAAQDTAEHAADCNVVGLRRCGVPGHGVEIDLALCVSDVLL